MTITTNHHWRPFLSFYDLSSREQKELDEERSEETFVRYCGSIYSLSDFVSFDSPWLDRFPEAKGWDGMLTDSFFSGLLIKVDPDGERYQIGLMLT